MQNIKSIELDGEKIHLNKSKIFGWGVVHPNKNEDGSTNWFNILTGGSWLKLIITIIIILIVLGFFYEYSTNLKLCSEMFQQINQNLSVNPILNLTV